jgi:Family of unknown function (DUF5335)
VGTTDPSVGFSRMCRVRAAPTVSDVHFTRELDKSQWATFLESLTQELPISDVRIDIISPELGDEVEADGLILEAMSYDSRGDVFEVAAGRGGPTGPALVHHRVDHPQHIWVDSRAGILPSSVAVDDEDGVRTLLRITQAPPLTS